MKPLYRLTPHKRLNLNPLFAYEVRRVRWGSSGEVMLKASQRWLVLVAGILLLAWGVLLVSDRDTRQASNNFLQLLFGLSLLAALVLDYRAMSSALGSINREMIALRWDLLRLTPLRDDQLIAAKHGVAQVHTWRFMILIVALRLAVALMSILSLVYIALRDDVYVGSSLLSQDLAALFVILLLSAVFVAEPFWRMRAVTALGVAISARARQPTSALLSGIGAVVGLWLVQAIILVALASMVSLLFLPLTLLESAVNSVTICAPFLAVGLFAGTVYGFYNLVQTWSLRSANRWLARLD